MTKYGNVKTAGYASKREAKRGAELKLLAKAGRITGLSGQQTFELIPAQYADGKRIERSCSYVADFIYLEQHAPGQWRKVVEDVKGVRTPAYIIKRKLMLFRLGIRVREV